MKSIINIGFQLIIVLLLITSCNVKTQIDPISFDGEYLNNQILLRPASYLNSFKIKDSITLELKYNSTNRIVFPRNFNLRYFEKSEGGWVEIDEKPVERYPLDNFVFSPENSTSPIQVLYGFPKILDATKKCHLRMYVTGVMDTSEGPIDVVAFTDVVLSP